MNRIKAWWYMDKAWYFEVYKVQYNNQDKLTKDEKMFLSTYKNKTEVQIALNRAGIDLYQGPRISLKDGVHILRIYNYTHN